MAQAQIVLLTLLVVQQIWSCQEEYHLQQKQNSYFTLGFSHLFSPWGLSERKEHALIPTKGEMEASFSVHELYCSAELIENPTEAFFLQENLDTVLLHCIWGEKVPPKLYPWAALPHSYNLTMIPKLLSFDRKKKLRCTENSRANLNLYSLLNLSAIKTSKKLS